MHPQNARDFFLFLLARVVDLRPAPHHAGVDPHVGKLASFILHDLEGDAREGLLIAAAADLLGLRDGV